MSGTTLTMSLRATLGARACGRAKMGNVGIMLVETGPMVHGERGEQSIAATAILPYHLCFRFSLFSLFPRPSVSRLVKNRLDQAQGGM